ncbi:MAG: DNA primase [Oscillospiraceae bacterium]|nr:DNA primase [Oscillospiraceae bacterium]
MPLPQDFMDELHERNDIVDVIGSYVSLNHRGRLYTALCPFHNEKTPSFTVFPDTSSFYCFGCHEGGDVISFVMKYENLEYIEAVRLLADRSGMTLPDGTDQSAAQRKKRILEANKTAARFFFSMLNSDQGRNARKYLRDRGLQDRTITKYGIGYAPNTWDSLKKHMRQKGFSDDELVDAGLCSRSQSGNVTDFFRERVMFPVIDLRGQIIAFSGRTIGDDNRKYLNTRDTPVFKKSRTLFSFNFAKNSDQHRLILVEGQMDVISLWQAGFTEAVATLGTAITEEHAQLISRYVNEVLICYDSDEAGQRATRRAIDILRAAGIDTGVIEVVGAKDPDELIKNSGAAAFRALIDKASGSMEYELNKALRKYDIEVPEDRVKYIDEAVSILARSGSATETEVWAGKVAQQTGVDKSTILYSVQRKRSSKQSADTRKENDRFAQSIGERYNLRSYEREKLGAVSAERRLTALVCAHPDLCRSIRSRVTGEDFSSPEVGAVFDSVCGLIESNDFSGFTSASSVLEPDQVALLAGMIAESSSVQYKPQDADFFIDKILENRSRVSSEDVKNMSAEDIEKMIRNRKGN